MKNKKLTVLIVDDSPLIVDRLIRMLAKLENTGKISHAGSFDEAMVLLNESEPDIMLLDINMPGKNGIDLLKRIKENGLQIEVIVITNRVNTYTELICKNLGASHFFDKSNDFEKIPAVIAMI